MYVPVELNRSIDRSKTIRSPLLHPCNRLTSSSSPSASTKQDEGSPIETSLAAFQRQFAKQDQFRLGCGLCILLQDQLLTRAQVGAMWGMPCVSICLHVL